MKKIAVEEHANRQDIEHIDKRLKDMDEAGIDMQVMSFSLGPGDGIDTSDAVSMARNANDMLAEVVQKYPDRFAGFATLPIKEPAAAARELERAVLKLGLKGTLIYVGHDGDYIDTQKYWVIYETAEKLDVPVYLHPGRLLPDMSAPYMTYPILSMATWGFAALTGLQAMRLICSGAFDKYPSLKIMLGHLGEGIPYFLWRIDKHWLEDRQIAGKDAPGNRLQKKPSEYFKENFYVTTSGMLWPPVLQFVISALGADRILFATDYPPESALEAAQFIESVPISESDREKICHLNAEKLLRL